MNIRLTEKELAWLSRKVERGEFANIDEAAAAAIRDSMASEVSDLAWARPLVEEARAAVLNGDILDHEGFRQFIADERAKNG
jgi:antitoxin ParD1/3/4